MKKTLLILSLLVSFMGISQNRTCGAEAAMQQLQFNPLMKNLYDQQKIASEQEYQNLLNNPIPSPSPQATIYIPVAVHFPTSGSASATVKNCLKQLAQTQIDILNADYNAANSDIYKWNNFQPTYYPSINNGVMDVQFVLATLNHPASSGLTDGEVAVTFGNGFTGTSDWDANWAGYLNLVVKDLNGGVLGYAYMGSNPSSGAAVFINTFAFGSGSGCTGYVPGSPYNLGRTLTHELGHYMNLEHIWGAGAGCGTDYVADTPLHDTANFGCPSIAHFSTCTGTPRELHMNYMDYTNDACMYMFTAGQATRMQAHLNLVKSGFKSNVLASDKFDFEAVKVAVYPNPSNGVFDLTLSNNNFIESVAIYDIMGRIVYSNDSVNDELVQINLDNPTSGVYNVVVKSEDSVYTSKIVVR